MPIQYSYSVGHVSFEDLRGVQRSYDWLRSSWSIAEACTSISIDSLRENDELFVTTFRKLPFQRRVIQYIKSTQSMFYVIACWPHPMIMVKQISRRLVIICLDDLPCGIQLVWKLFIFIRLKKFVKVVGVIKRKIADSEVSLIVEPTQRISIISWPSHESMNMRRNRNLSFVYPHLFSGKT